MMMQAGQDTQGVVYHGYRQPFKQVIVVESAEGAHVSVLRHIPLYSPSGMNWGYAGAGPRETARSLLIDALGAEAVCPDCKGTGRVVYLADGDGYRCEPFSTVTPARTTRPGWASCRPQSRHGWPCQCSGGYKHLPSGPFAEQFVARWGDEWIMSRASILAWLAQYTDNHGRA